MASMNFGFYIRHLRKSKGYGLRKAAEKLGITPGHLSRVENGFAATPSGDVLLAMAQLYEVPASDLAELVDRKRGLEVATADQNLADVVTTFYRLAMHESRDEQIKLLQGMLSTLDLSPEKRAFWEREIAKLGDKGGTGLHRLARGSNELYDLYATPRCLSKTALEQMALKKLREYFKGDLNNYAPPTPIEEIIEFCEDDLDLTVFGVEVGGRFTDGSPAVLGRCRWKSDGRREVGIHEHLFEATNKSARRRGNFTLAHEYLHAIEHLPRMAVNTRGLSFNRIGDSPAFVGSGHIAVGNTKRGKPKPLSSNEDWREFQANAFAAALLMPAFAVKQYFTDLIGAEIEVPASRVKDVARDVASLAIVEDATDGGPQSLADVFDVNPTPMGYRLEQLGLVKAMD